MEEDTFETEKELVESIKREANELFSKGEFQEAIQRYTQAILNCPEDEKRLMSVLYSNRAACHIMLDNIDSALVDSNDAIEFDDTYTKAYLRRFTVLEKKEKWHDALRDINKAFELDENLKNDLNLVKRHKNVEKNSTELFNKEKEEMVGKLKDLGNMFLGKVGLSLDNFQVEQNPQTGSYNIQFKQN
ncbi:TPR Domain containing [Cryptosporidium sp. chipmunk genotype I]|uniref:TPR Domain containing n=1 Tax=Cryptosporidium sp. chipmunk genotype I TaxID=1280935 RepID=UPI00351A3EB4|nr:TPR Domain containing [Cryptosporidium sp. chipmunk genotype I]